MTAEPGPPELASSTGRASFSRNILVSESFVYRKLRLINPVPTKTHRSPTDHRIFEQSTTDIWQALCTCCKAVLASSGIPAGQVKGIGFDATCSLAVVDRNGKSMSVSRTGSTEEEESDEHLGVEGGVWDIVLWADHRAEAEADVINATGNGVLGFVGKTMSVSRLVIISLAEHDD